MLETLTKEKLNDVGIFILQGMSEREACLLAEISYNALQKIKEQNQMWREYFEKKHIEFKYNHLREIQKNKSEKNSQWLLEKLRPEEFGARAKPQEQPTINIISALIKDIQNDTQNIVAISRDSVREIESHKDDSDRKITVAEILN